MTEIPTFEVTHHRPDDADLDRRIQGLMVAGHYYELDLLIDGINGGHYRLWTRVPFGSQWAWVVVANRGRRQYLKTEPDWVEPNNLLALPRC